MPESAEGATIHGLREGRWVFVDSALHARVEGSYRGGRRDGVWTLFVDGRRRTEGHYHEGVPDGVFRSWGPDGKLLGESRFVAGTGHWTEWNPEKVIVEDGDCEAGLRHGAWTRLSESGSYDHGVAHGHWRVPAELGNPNEVAASEGDYVHGHRDGMWVDTAPRYWEMPVTELEAQHLPHVPRDDEHLVAPARLLRGEYREGRRIGKWTVTAVDATWRGYLEDTIDYDAAKNEEQPSEGSPYGGKLPTIGVVACPVPHDDHGRPSELP
jgi:hypothetical protein